jgi:hypothetical protein
VMKKVLCGTGVLLAAMLVTCRSGLAIAGEASV